MPTFALVTEGGTDQAILKNILNGLAIRITGDELDWSASRPEVSAGKQTTSGGWERVFEFIENQELFTDMLLRNNCVVIHIDTDCATHKNFGIELHQGGERRPTQDIIKDIKTLMSSKMSEELINSFQHKILFAIAVHSTECWLLPLYGKRRTPSNEQNCERKLAVELSKKNDTRRYLINKEMKLIKDFSIYDELSSPYYEEIDAREVCIHNESLEQFITDALAFIEPGDDEDTTN